MISDRQKRPDLAALLAIFVLLLAACGAPAAPQGESLEPIRIGALFDLSGATKEVGKPYSIGEQLFIDWKNGHGRVAGRELKLISNDYLYQIPKAEELYAQYVNQHKVAAIAGWGTGDTEALKNKIAQDKLPFVSASYSAALADPSEAPYNFLVGTTYSDQLIIAQKWALMDWSGPKHTGAPKFAYLINDSPFGRSPTEDGKKYALANGVAEPLIVTSPRGIADLTQQLNQIKDYNANYVFIQNTSAPAALALTNAKALGMMATTRFICLNWCADELVIQPGNAATEGLIGIIPFAPPSTGAVGARVALDYAKFRQADLAGSELHFVQGWWSMAILVEGIERAAQSGQPVNGASIKAALETITNFSTGDVTAAITFNAKDHAGSKTSRVYMVKDGKWQALTGAMSAE